MDKKDWRIALKRTWQALKDKDLASRAASLAYYATLTFFPAALGIVTIMALIVGPEQMLQNIQDLHRFMPKEIAEVVDAQITPLLKSQPSKIGLAAVTSIGLVLWSTSGGIQNLIKAVNMTFEEEETRGFVKLRIISLAFSAGALLLGVLVIGLLLAQASSLQGLGAPQLVVTVFPYLRWAILVVIITLVLAVLYRYAPDRTEPRWQIVSWGATAATIIWLAGTALFFYYVQHFANFGKTYGTFAGIFVLMTWFNLTSLIILICGQVNKKLEEQTADR